MTEWPRPAIINLRSILANLYPMREDGMRLAGDADLNRGLIRFSDQALANWTAILDRANAEDKVDALIDLAIEENKGNDSLRAAKDRAPPPPVEGPETEDWQGDTAPAQLERILGTKSTLVSIRYLEMGLLRARSVVRIKRADGGLGTGFAVANGLIITNNHVLPSAELAKTAVAEFNYQQTVDGLNAQPEPFELVPDDYFRTSKPDDWTAVRIKGDASKWGELELKADMAVKAGDHVNIIQHPGGAQKQLSFVANVVAFADATRVQYLTDTLPGSSGSPVFDVEWNLIALHHSGGWISEPNAKTKSTYYRNEGIAIGKVIEGLAAP